MESSREKARACPRCGALNGAGFDRCIRCAEPLAPLAAGFEALKTGVDARSLWGTKTLFVLTVLVFMGQLAMMGGHYEKALLSGGSNATMLQFGALLASPERPFHEPFRLLSAVFVHFGAIHLLMNMLGLANLGRVAEPGIGTSRFVLAYLTCGVLGFSIDVLWGTAFVEGLATRAADALSFTIDGPWGSFTAGASGAVFGINGMILGWLIYNRDRRWRSYAIQAVFYAVVLRILIRINISAHLGGLLVGTLLGVHFARNPRPKNLLLANLGAIVGLLLSILSLVLAQRAAHWGRKPRPAAHLEVRAATTGAAPTADLRIRSGPRSAPRFDSSHEVAV